MKTIVTGRVWTIRYNSLEIQSIWATEEDAKMELEELRKDGQDMWEIQPMAVLRHG
jgi:hypothetical protein